jgi:uncharacterized protein
VSLRLDETNLPAFARGCGVLAAGGAGDVELGLLMARVAVREHGPVPVIALDDLPAGAFVLPCGMIGAPSLAGERIFSGDEGRLLCAEMERMFESRVDALMCLEAAGMNGPLTVTWAARAGLPLLDADGAGRGFPGLGQRTMSVGGVSANPLVLTDGLGNVLVSRCVDNGWAQRLAAGACAGLGGICAAATYAMSTADARAGAIPGSVSRAIAAGRAILARGRSDGPAAVAGALGGSVLIEGHVVGVEADSATIAGLAHDAGRQVRVEYQAEFLLVLEDGAVRAAVPDLISLLAAGSGAPLAAEALSHGDRVAVVSAPADKLWRCERGRAIAGPHAFGYELDHVQA